MPGTKRLYALLLWICIHALVTGADAQIVPKPGAVAPPVVGSTYGNTPSNYSDPTKDPNRYRQTDSFGKTCLSVGGYGRPFVTNPNLYDHVIIAINNCPKRISFEICYYQTRNCLNVDMPAQQRKEVILGIQPNVKDFRYEFREKSS